MTAPQAHGLPPGVRRALRAPGVLRVACDALEGEDLAVVVAGPGVALPELPGARWVSVRVLDGSAVWVAVTTRERAGELCALRSRDAGGMLWRCPRGTGRAVALYLGPGRGCAVVPLRQAPG